MGGAEWVGVVDVVVGRGLRGGKEVQGKVPTGGRGVQDKMPAHLMRG